MTCEEIPGGYEEFVRRFVEELATSASAQSRMGEFTHLRFFEGVEVKRGRSFTRLSNGRAITLDVTLEAAGHPLWVFECKDYARKVEIGRLGEHIGDDQQSDGNHAPGSDETRDKPTSKRGAQRGRQPSHLRPGR